MAVVLAAAGIGAILAYGWTATRDAERSLDVDLDTARSRAGETTPGLLAEERAIHDRYASRLGSASQVTLAGILALAVGAAIGFVLLSRREQRQARDLRERQLRDARLHGLASRINEIELVLALDGRILEANDRALAAYGRSREEILRLGIADLRAPATLARLPEHLARAASEDGARFETEHLHRDGTPFPVEVSARRFSVGEEHFIHSVVRDLTEQRRGLAELRRSEALYRAIARSFPNGLVAIFDHDLRYVLVDGTGDGLGGPKEALTGRLVREIYTPDEVAIIEPVLRRALLGETVDTEVASRGQIREVHAGPVRDAQGEVILGIATSVEISARKAAERALSEERARLALLVEHAPAAIALFDREMRYLAASRRWLTDYGLGDREVVGRSHYEIFPDLPDRWREAHRRCLAGAVEKCDDDPFPRAGGGTDRVRWEIHPWRTFAGEVGGIVIFSEVVTERHRLQEQLAVASRLAALGTLVHGLAHEINNPLAGEMSGQGLALESLRTMRNGAAAGKPLDREAMVAGLDEVLEILADSQSASLRIARIVRDLNVMGHPDFQRTPVRLTDVVTEAVRRVGPELAGRAAIQVDAAETPPVMASAGHLEQVIECLLQNAVQAIPDGRSGHVTVRVRPVDEGRAAIDVVDDGAGIAPDVMQRIFDPFFTTRRVGQGKGLGLPVSHAIVTAHGGILTAESHPGRGSTFRVELPTARC